jgi:hypothetical protein
MYMARDFFFFEQGMAQDWTVLWKSGPKTRRARGIVALCMHEFGGVNAQMDQPYVRTVHTSNMRQRCLQGRIHGTSSGESAYAHACSTKQQKQIKITQSYP